MTQTLTLPRQPRAIRNDDAHRAKAERILRDVAYVLHLTERIGLEICGSDRPELRETTVCAA